MSRIPGVRRFFRIDRGAPDVARAVDDELLFHFDMAVRHLMSQGLDEDDARREAERRFGDVTATRERLNAIDRDRAGVVRRAEWREGVWQDLRYAARGARKNPGFAAIVALTLALGIGATATMFGVIDRLLLTPPAHLVHAGQLKRVYFTVRPSGAPEFTMASTGYATYTALAANARAFEGVAAYSTVRYVAGRGIDATRITVGTATSNFFPLVGVAPVLGRLFTGAEDEPPKGTHVAVLDYGYWMREFGGDPAVLGRQMTIDARTFTVIGVLPAGFTGVDLRKKDVWIPISAGQHPTPDWPITWSSQWLRVVARARSGVSEQQMSDDAMAVYRRAYAGGNRNVGRALVSVRPIAFQEDGRERPETPVARWLSGVAIIVLLIAAANVANLLLARAMRRRREMGVRLALGIGQARLVRMLVTEGVVLAAIGGALGLAVAYGGGQLMRRVLLADVVWTSPPVDQRVLMVAAVLALSTGLLVGLVPALQMRRTDVASVLKAGGREGTLQRSRARIALLVAQGALSVTLLVGAGLFIRSLANVRGKDLGVQPDRVLVADVAWPQMVQLTPQQMQAERARREAVWDRVLAAVTRMPEVVAASVAIGSPFGFGFSVRLRVPGWDSIPRISGNDPYVSAVTGSYFATVGTPLIKGRVFRPDEGANTERVAIVNETMARALWPNQDPLGKCIIAGETETACSTVIGVVKDAQRFSIREEPAMQYYMPLGQQHDFGGSVLMVRPRGKTTPLIAPVRATIATFAPEARFIDVQLMQDRVDPQIRPWRLGATMFGLFGALALLVAAIGLYSVIAYLVAQRTHEFGVRVALGARGRDVVGRVLGEGLRLAVAGIVIGCAISFYAGRWIEPLLFDESSHDPAVFGVVSVTLLVVAIVATIVPAWRASRVDPAVALRAD